ncbi:MAG: zf-HC2 domain-containing protein [Actinobacteria bacterium]|nr:zf-HC2 domain-containing protein [Actinomycetota bacterium]
MAGSRDGVRLEEVYARQGHRLYNFLRWLAGEPHAAISLTEQAFLHYARRTRTERDPRRAASLLYRLAVKIEDAWESRQRWRERLTRGRSSGAWVTGGETSHSSPDAEAFRAALRRISSRSRAVLLLREMEQMPHEQLEEMLNVSSSSLRRRLFSAREEMVRALGRPAGATRQCRQTWVLLSANRDGNLSLQEQEQLKAHLGQCPWCADRSREYEQLARQFQALPRQDAPEELREKVFGTPTSLGTPWVIAPIEILLAVIVGAVLVAVGVSLGTAAWQSGLLAVLFERPFTGPSIYVANATEKGSISVIAARGERVTSQVPLGATPRSLALSPDYQWLYVAHDLGVSVLSTKDNSVSGVIQVPGGAQRVLVHPASRQVYALSATRGPVPGRLWSYDATSRARLDQAIAGFDPYEAAISPDGRRIYIVGGRDTTLTIIETSRLSNTRSLRLPQPGYDYSLVPSPDSQLLYAIDRRRGTVTLVDAAGPAVVRTLPLGRPREISAGAAGIRPSLVIGGSAAISADGKRLYVVSPPPDEGVRIFDTQSFAEVARISRQVNGVAIGPDALYLTSPVEGALLIVDPATYQVIATVQVGENPYSIIYKP